VRPAGRIILALPLRLVEPLERRDLPYNLISRSVFLIGFRKSSSPQNRHLFVHYY